MTEALDDKALKWVVERIYSYSRWSNNPFDLPQSFGSGTLTGSYRARAHNILLYLQNEAKVLQIIAEPEPETDDPYNGKSIFDVSAEDTPRQTYSIQLLPAFEDYAASIISKSSRADESSVSMELKLDGDSLVLKTPDSQETVHKFNADLPPYKVLQFLIANPNKILTRQHIEYQLSIKGLELNPPEFVRHLGLRNELRDLFLSHRTKAEIELKNPVVLSREAYQTMLKSAS
jgi:hypothetical protein